MPARSHTPKKMTATAASAETAYLPAMRIRQEQPEINRSQQRGIAEQVQQPQLRHATMFRGHFTVTVKASLVERYSG